MGVTSQILLEKPTIGVYRPGQTVIGKIRYTIDQPTEYCDIVLSFNGKGECAWSEMSFYPNLFAPYPYLGTEEYISVHQQILDKKGAETIILPSGTYEREFKFILPKNIPPTYNDENCVISYKLKLKFVKSGLFKSKIKFYATIPVQGTVDSTEPNSGVIFGLYKPLIKPLSSKKHEIDLTAEVSGTVVKPGDEAKLSFVVKNDTNVVIPKLKTEIICFTHYTAKCGKTKSKTAIDVIAETTCIPAEAEVNLSTLIKTLPEMYSIHNSKIISREYKMKVTMLLPVPYVNSSILLPIKMAVREDEEPIEVLDKPPSYWEVMSEDDKT